MTSIQTRIWFCVILAAYCVLAVHYSFMTPPFEASDELWHYPMVRYIATSGFQLPVQDPTVQTAWRQQGSQPPLYYLLAAVLTAPLPTGDMDYWRRINPHADIGVIRADANANMIVHRPEEATNRWTGTLLALQTARFFSVLLGAGTVATTFLLARTLFPSRADIALTAAGFNAFLPMFLFISGSVNNDNLSNFLGGVLTLLTVRLLVATTAPRVGDYILLGLAMGCGLLAKLNLGFFIPLIALSLVIVSLRRRDWRPLIIGGLVSGALTLAIAGWWYIRNVQLYGDPTGLNVFLDIVGRRATPATLAQLWSERDSFLWAFWGFFGGVNVPMAGWVYTIYSLLALLGFVGAVAYVAAMAGRQRSSASVQLSFGIAHLLTLLWIAVSFVSYLRWTAETPASQGRLMFGAIGAISLWLAVGWGVWLGPRLRPILILMIIAFAGLAILRPLGIANPYVEATAGSDPQDPFVTLARAVTPPPRFVQFASPGDGGRLALVSSALQETARPGDDVNLVLNWSVVTAASRDWSLFVHLVTSDGVIIGQRDVYPARGVLAASDLAVGRTWYNPVAVNIPINAYAPGTLAVNIGWYHLPSGERMQQDNGSETYTIGQIDLLARESPFGVPNPISVSFGGQIELVGYRMSDLSPRAGTPLELSLYWRALQPLSTDYTVFAQVLDRQTTAIYAASDAMPAAWTRPTTSWSIGEIIEDKHILQVNPDTPPAIYDVNVGLYTRDADGSFQRLRVVTADGGEAFDFAALSRVRVLPAEPGP